MAFLTILVSVVYFILVFKLGAQSRNADSEKSRKITEARQGKQVYEGSFSVKPFNNFYTLFFLSMLFMFFMLVVNILGKAGMEEIFDMEETSYVLTNIFVCVLFVVFGAYSIYFAWISIATRGEFLIVQEEKIVGAASSISGRDIKTIDVNVNIADIKEIVIVRKEKTNGLEMSSLVIRANDNNYEFLMPVDPDGVKSIIENRMNI